MNPITPESSLETDKTNVSPTVGEVTPALSAAPAVVGATVAKKPINPGLIVLQWLTYAFWGWTVLALSALTASVVANLVDSAESSGGFTSYGIAAVLVLLPISYICDSFYSKREPETKVGAEIWVMIIHAVLFALFGIGALICAVIALVILSTSSSSSTAALTTLISSLIIAGFYALTFLRTLNPSMLRWIQKTYKFAMLGLVGVIAIMGLVGPVANERKTRDDRLISGQISSVASEISQYARSNNKLPASLADIDAQGDTKTLIDRNLVEYKPEGQATSATTLDNLGNKSLSSSRTTTYKYQLCVTYKQASNSRYGTNDYNNNDDEGYTDYVYASNHEAGDVCYKMKTTNY